MWEALKPHHVITDSSGTETQIVSDLELLATGCLQNILSSTSFYTFSTSTFFFVSFTSFFSNFTSFLSTAVCYTSKAAPCVVFTGDYRIISAY